MNDMILEIWNDFIMIYKWGHVGDFMLLTCVIVRQGHQVRLLCDVCVMFHACMILIVLRIWFIPFSGNCELLPTELWTPIMFSCR